MLLYNAYILKLFDNFALLLGMQVPSAPLVPAVLQTPLLPQAQQQSSCVVVSNMFDPSK